MDPSPDLWGTYKSKNPLQITWVVNGIGLSPLITLRGPHVVWVFCCFSFGGWWSCQSRWRWSGCFLPEAHALVFCNNHVLLNMRITITLCISGILKTSYRMPAESGKRCFCREFWSLKLLCCNTVSPLFWCWDTVVVRLFHPRKAAQILYFDFESYCCNIQNP